MCGIPVIATDNGGIHEYLINGVNGILCKMKDYAELSESLYKIYCGKISFNPTIVRESVINKFNNESFKTLLGEIYEGAMGTKTIKERK